MIALYFLFVPNWVQKTYVQLGASFFENIYFLLNKILFWDTVIRNRDLLVKKTGGSKNWAR